jgi:ABC-type multidrug transport system fused ATPase/permease subunit
MISLKKLWLYFPLRKKIYFFIVLFLMLISSIAEVISIGSVIPFIKTLTDPELVMNYSFLQPFFVFFNIRSSSELLLPVSLFFSSMVLLAGVIRIIFLYYINKFSFSVGLDLGALAYKKTLFKNFLDHTDTSSSKVISIITQKIQLTIFNILIPILNIINSIILGFAIFITLFIFNPLLSISCLLFFGGTYFLFNFFTKKRKLQDSVISSKSMNKTIKILQESLNNIRNIIIDNSYDEYLSLFKKTDRDLKQAQLSISFFSQFPKFIIESIGIIFIIMIAIYLYSKNNNISDVLIPIGVLALSAQKLLPLLQKIYHSWYVIKSSFHAFSELIDLLDSSDKNKKPTKQFSFNKRICLNNISFKYKNNNNYVLQNISLEINKGDVIGIIGETGSGKSTLVDIILGLVPPSSGSISIDGHDVNFEKHLFSLKSVCYVPQNIFLSDSSVKSNIHFGHNCDLSINKVIKSCKKANIHDHIMTLENQYESEIGELGSRLSGGQKQKLAFARLFYKNFNFIILDESTSALDTKTEELLIKEINQFSKNKTIIMIAHRISSLKNCNKILEVKNKKITTIDKKILLPKSTK